MLPAGLLPHLDDLSVERVVIHDQNVTLVVAAREPSATCPRCAHRSERIHSRYQRTLLDLPIGPNTVALHVRVRRFRCAKQGCSQRIFAERFTELGQVRARRTHGQQAALEKIGLALGGAAGARLARRIGFPASRSTIIRFVRGASEPCTPTPRVLGVDDWARRRGQTYGTVLVDLERRRPVDLLPERTAEALTNWLAEHPGVEIIARDRAGAYADGARRGAPNAIQVADRFHLAMNVGEALERVLARKHSDLKAAAARVDQLMAAAESEQMTATVNPPSPLPAAPEQLTRQKQLKQARRARRLERYEAAIALYEQGWSQRAISRELGIGKNTAKRHIRAGEFPEQAVRKAKPSILAPYEPYLRARWTDGCHNAHSLWEEIRGQGFVGSAPLVRQFVARWRPSPGRSGKAPRRNATAQTPPIPPVRRPIHMLSPRQARWLLLHDVDDLRTEDRLYREQLLEGDEELRSARSLTEEFGRIVRVRDRLALEPWLGQAEHSGVGEFRQFALVLRRDLGAVEAALTYDWSNGQTEGQINRLKMLKRQMYGRASLGLLRRRFLCAA